MHAFRIEVRDGAEFLDLWLALVDAGRRIGPGVDVGLAEAGLHRAADDAVDIGDRTVGGDSTDVDCGGRDRVRDHAADRIVRAAGAAGADTEKPLLRKCRYAADAKSAQAGAERQHVTAGDHASHELSSQGFRLRKGALGTRALSTLAGWCAP